MARTYEMTWDGRKTRWKKMYKGKMYIVSCRELNTPLYTKEASCKLANEWWRRKLSEIEQPARRLLDRAEFLAEGIAQDTVGLALLKAREDIARLKLDNEALKERVAQGIDKYGQRIAAVNVEGPEDTSLGFQMERFLADEKARGKAPGTYGDLAYYVRKMLPLLPAQVTEINERTVSDFYAWVRNETNSVAVIQRKIWNYFRRFIRHLWGHRLIELPRNLEFRTFDFGTGVQKIKTYPLSEVKALLASLPPRLKLYALLGLNCGMLPVDMAMLRHTEYRNGRITRKRTKTHKRENVPEVCYLLWEETVSLLERYPRTHPDFVLTSKTGTPLWRIEIRDGKAAKCDIIGKQWNRGYKNRRIPLKALRSVAATLLDHQFGEAISTLFLGHAPRGVKNRH